MANAFLSTPDHHAAHTRLKKVLRNYLARRCYCMKCEYRKRGCHDRRIR